ncbi:MAG TPA: tetratricopeptide repeat protein [Ktedonobacteraceae bacterium]|nr:tetratricopeptide repeat protein [Ktedonobacteraceae bacterium]
MATTNRRFTGESVDYPSSNQRQFYGFRLLLWPGDAAGVATARAAEKHWQQAEEQRRKRVYYLKNIEIYRRAVDYDPRDELAWRGLGNSHSALAKYAEALNAFQHALQCQPTASACAGTGDAGARLARYAEAITFYSSALKLDHDVALNYSDFIHALQATGKASEAVQMQVWASKLGYFDNDDEIE